MATEVTFIAQEYQSNGSFKPQQFTYKGDEANGWKILRGDELFMELPRGYTLIKTSYCGICNTDTSRHYLPFPLPQVTGHEVVGYDKNNQPVAVEINASHFARGLNEDQSRHCRYCLKQEQEPGIDRQCPERITLGIDRLPGGFSPYVLSPVDSVIPIPEGLSLSQAVIWEPLAAALWAAKTTPARRGTKVGVLGPRKLGLLIIFALHGLREKSNDYTITALARHRSLLDLSKKVGADELVYLDEDELPQEPLYDILYDTTGSVDGFSLALKLSNRILHLKSTSGGSVFGVTHFTQMVVEEISLLPFIPEAIMFGWPTDFHPRRNINIFVADSVNEHVIESAKNHVANMKMFNGSAVHFHRLSVEQAIELLDKPEFFLTKGGDFPRFDLAIISKIEEIDQVIRPTIKKEISLVRARGAILMCDNDVDYNNNTKNTKTYEHPIQEAILGRNIQIWTSRCGDARDALKLLKDNPDLASKLEKEVFTHEFELKDINKAFDTARSSKECIKARIKIEQKQ
jgi:threonine dehydrogenase-like Zn-dependent dehydrogenase